CSHPLARHHDRDADVASLAATEPAPETLSGASSDGDSDQALTESGKRKRRTSIPSWDDILFGTRSEEDPS
ncbi:MAG: hypothetical protein GX814_02255, partial [Microbacteriaceae bacterium]|nr:hypothetical protein [Microbacteriaceae bacterium]